MTQHIDPCETARVRVLAAALVLQQCTKTAANIVPIPGKGQIIAIGTRADVARLLELEPAAEGSATGIDLAKMSRDEVIKIMIKRDMLSQHGYRTLLNGDFISLNLDHLTALANAALANAALARATPQHPGDLSNAEFLSKRLARVAKLAGVTMPTGTHEQIAEVAGTILGDIARHLEKAATPQHSVTEQAQCQTCGMTGWHVCYKPRAQPLASTAAAQPEQASDFAVRFIEQRAQKYLDENAHSDWDTGSVIFNCGEAGQDYYNSLVEMADDIRAALAIPASIAPIQQENEQANVLPPTRGTGVQRNADGDYFSSEDVLHIIRDIRTGDGWSGDDWDFALANAAADELARRFRAQGGSTNNDSIPASTAASEQQASVSDATLESALMDVLTQHTELSTDAIDERVPQLVSAIRATIPSEVDELPEPFDYVDMAGDTRAPVYSDDQMRAALTHRATTATPGLLDEILSLAEQGMCHGLTADDFCSEIVAKIKALAAVPGIATTAAPDGYRWYSVDGKQHDTGRVVHADGGYFATTASPEDAKLIADAMNGVGATTAADQQGAAQPPQSDPKSPQSEGAAQAQAGERLKAAILAALDSNETEMEGYSYFGSNPGVPKDCYDDVADEVIAAMAAPATSDGGKA